VTSRIRQEKEAGKHIQLSKKSDKYFFQLFSWQAHLNKMRNSFRRAEE
jgi:hypothetical protein